MRTHRNRFRLGGQEQDLSIMYYLILINLLVYISSHFDLKDLILGCFDLVCLVSSPRYENWESHWSQAYLTPSCFDSMWVLRLCCCVNWELHWSQVYLTPSCLNLMCLLRQHYSVNCKLIMFWLNVFFKTTFLYSLVVTLVTSIPDTFMFWFNVSF